MKKEISSTVFSFDNGVHYVEGLGLVKVPRFVYFIARSKSWLLRPTGGKGRSFFYKDYGGVDKALLALMEVYKGMDVPIYQHGKTVYEKAHEYKKDILPVGIFLSCSKKVDKIMVSDPLTGSKTHIYIPVAAKKDQDILDSLMEEAFQIRKKYIDCYLEHITWRGLHVF